MPRPISALTTFIRSLPADLAVKEVIAQAKAAGHETSAKNVSRVRAMAASKPAQTTSKPKATGKPASETTPKRTTPKKATAAPNTAVPTPSPVSLSKSDFIRRHPDLSTADLIAAGDAAGVKFTSSLVYMVRGKQAGKAAPKKAKRAAPTKTAAPKRTTPAKKAPGKKSPTSKPARTKAATTTTKADFVRERAHLSPKEVVEDARAAGVELGVTYVYNVRGQDKAVASKKAMAVKKAPSSKPAVSKTAPAKSSKPTQPAKAAQPTAANGTGSSGSSVEDLLRAAAAELGLGRAIEILQVERARVRAVIGG